MKKIIGIFKGDLKSITKNLIIFVVVIGISILPALYAWFNIASNWDPYSATSGLAFAVYSNDKGYAYKELTVNAGEELLDNVRQNNQIGWDITESKDEAVDGVYSGKYYAAIVVPENFSENLLSITTGKFQQAQLEYYVNEKKNAVAPKITDKVSETLQTSIESAYVGTLAKVLATALDLTYDTMEEDKGKIAEKITVALKDAQGEINALSSSVDLLISTLDSIDSLVKSNKEMLPSIENSLSKAGVFTTDIKTTLESTRNSAAQISASVEGIIESCEAYTDNITSQATEAFAVLSSDAAAASDKLAKIKTVNEKVKAVNNKVISMLQTIQSDLGIDCSRAIARLNAANSKQDAIEAKIDECCGKIKATGSLPENLQSELNQLIAEAGTEIAAAQSEYAALKQSIDSAVTKSFSALDDIADFIKSLSGGTDQLSTAFDSASETTGNLKKMLVNFKTQLSDLNKKTDNVIAKVDKAKNDNTIENVVLPIIEKPESLGSFLSSPVSCKTTRVYGIENYGSAMTPFYSSLAIWVGGIVLVAVLNVELSKRDRERLGKVGSTKLYFGRYLIFFFLGQIQALIIALGDLFFLKIQCVSPVLFILGSLVSSLVYTLIIYSLTITFSVIGKALSVIILVLQVAGSGGTFPIEVLPAPFQSIAPFLPFKYGVNLLRETLAEVSPEGYMYNLGMLLLFIVPSLLLGLFLRKPCMKIIAFFNRKLEESELVI